MGELPMSAAMLVNDKPAITFFFTSPTPDSVLPFVRARNGRHAATPVGEALRRGPRAARLGATRRRTNEDSPGVTEHGNEQMHRSCARDDAPLLADVDRHPIPFASPVDAEQRSLQRSPRAVGIVLLRESSFDRDCIACQRAPAPVRSPSERREGGRPPNSAERFSRAFVRATRDGSPPCGCQAVVGRRVAGVKPPAHGHEEEAAIPRRSGVEHVRQTACKARHRECTQVDHRTVNRISCATRRAHEELAAPDADARRRARRGAHETSKHDAAADSVGASDEERQHVVGSAG